MKFNELTKSSNQKILEEIQYDLIDMYKHIKMLCDSIGINVFFVGGSSLGAVRHNGFIPWDDDMDLGMIREDYEKFLKYYDKYSKSKKYFLKNPFKGGNQRFLQVYNQDTVLKNIQNIKDPINQKLTIDIFPYDNVPDYKILMYSKYILSSILMIIFSSVIFFNNINNQNENFYKKSLYFKLVYYIKILIGFLFSFKNSEYWFNLLDMIVKYDYVTKNVTSAYGSKHYYKEILPYNAIFPLKKENFEDLEVLIPKNVNYYLSKLYGEDYMDIPSNKEAHGVIEYSRIKEY